MKRIALCIGNNNYIKLPSLSAAINDAKAVAEELGKLGFTVNVEVDLTLTSFVNAINKFCDELKTSDSGILFYAGHGFENENKNFLIPIDFNPDNDPRSFPFIAYPLDNLLDQFKKDDLLDKTKIVILDACRDSFTCRGLSSSFAPVMAPAGTLIAFSTSPGQSADEGVIYNGLKHGKYTKVLLPHLPLPRIPVEAMFKRVRKQLAVETHGMQVSWEHTSLIEDYYLNPDSIFSNGLYMPQAYKDCIFKPTLKIVADIIQKLKSYDWPVQTKALYMLSSTDFLNLLNPVEKENPGDKKLDTLSPSDLFVIGRNIYQAAAGNHFDSFDFIRTLSNWKIDIKVRCHILNGMAYEIYFDKNNEVRRYFKTGITDTRAYMFVIEQLERPEFEASRRFIQDALLEIKDRPLYIPGKYNVIELTVNLEKYVFPESERTPNLPEWYKVKEILIDGKSTYESCQTKDDEIFDPKNEEFVRVKEFESRLKDLLVAPSDYVGIEYKVPDGEKELDRSSNLFAMREFYLKY